jgi:ornithine cyclodeaminase
MPRDIRIVTEAQLREVLTLDLALIDAIEAAFAALSTGGVVMPPILSMDLPQVHGEVDVKTAWLPGVPGFAIKVSPGFFDNPKIGLPSLNGLMVLLSATTGLVEAVFLDNGYLTDLRTAAAGAVAARHLAPATVTTCGVLGTGVQARLQVQAAHLVRPFTRVLVWGRDPQKAAACAADLGRTLGIESAAVSTPTEIAARCELIVTTTPSRSPVLRLSDFTVRKPEPYAEPYAQPYAEPYARCHITAMGSDQEVKNEIDPEILAAARLYVCDRISQAERLGELRATRAAGVSVNPVELGDIVSGRAPGRLEEHGITLCDLTGTGAQDTAIAAHVLPLLGNAGTVVRA